MIVAEEGEKCVGKDEIGCIVSEASIHTGKMGFVVVCELN